MHLLSTGAAYRPPTQSCIASYISTVYLFQVSRHMALRVWEIKRCQRSLHAQTNPPLVIRLAWSPRPHHKMMELQLKLLRVGPSSHCYALVAHRLRVKSDSTHSTVKCAANRKYSCSMVQIYSLSSAGPKEQIVPIHGKSIAFS